MSYVRRLLLGIALCAGSVPAGAQSTVADSIPPASRYAAAAAALERFIVVEMADKALPALSIALVDDQRVVWARGFGVANPRDSSRATARTVYRVGSVSKLFTDIGVMQLVEKGSLGLDTPVSRYLSDFRPTGTGASTITLRQLMSHRAGLVREPPTGHYFDNTAPSLAETVRSLNNTRLVYSPTTRSKYSNAGIAVAGRVLEQVGGERFESYLKRTVLNPIGLASSAFEPEPAFESRRAAATMWTLDGRTSVAPTFELGMAPAGSMYSTVLDLGQFMSVLFARGKGPNGQLLAEASLDEMWKPQFAAAGARSGFGLGFDIGAVDGKRAVRHGGAIYGFATELAALPDEKLGVAVAITKDGANAVAGRIADAALRLMMASVAGTQLPSLTTTTAVPRELAKQLDGTYGTGARRVVVVARDSDVHLTRASGFARSRLRMHGDSVIVDDELSFGPRVRLAGNRLIVGRDTLARTSVSLPAAAPARWRGLIGEYGWDYNTLYILERDGKLHALIEWFFQYPLTETAPGTFAFPASGLYDGERLVFQRRADGYATSVSLNGVAFPRRPIEGEDGKTFRIQPQRPIAELRAEALAATPPVETGRRASDLVDLATLDPTIKFDVRYATTNNFMGSVMYSEARAFLQRPAAQALLRAHRALGRQGYGLLIHDAYRPWYVTKMFWDATPDSSRVFVADPSQGSRHNRGAAVDLTLYDRRTGQPIQMVSGYDEFSARAYPDYPGGTSLQRYHRELLRQAMEAEGFRVFDAEWWHFDYQDWRLYPIGNQTFDKITARP